MRKETLTAVLLHPFEIQALALAFGVLLFFASPAFCDQQKENSAWKGEAEAGYLLTTGNSETQTANVKLTVVRETGTWKQTLQASGIYSSEKAPDTGEKDTTAEKYLVTGKSNYKLDEKNSIFGLAVYEDDRFSGYEYRLSLSAGYARQILKGGKFDLSVELGPGYRINKVEDKTDQAMEKNEFLFHAGGFFSWGFSDTAVFSQELTVDLGSEATVTRSVTALKANISGNLAMKLSYTVKNTSKVPQGTEKTDTESAITLVWGF